MWFFVRTSRTDISVCETPSWQPPEANVKFEKRFSVSSPGPAGNFCFFHKKLLTPAMSRLQSVLTGGGDRNGSNSSDMAAAAGAAAAAEASPQSTLAAIDSLLHSAMR